MFEIFCDDCLDWFSSDFEIDDCIYCGKECSIHEFGEGEDNE